MIQGTPRPIDLIGKSRLSDSFAGIGGFDHSKMGIGRLSTSGTLSELAGGAFSSLLGSRNVAALSEGLMPSLRTSGTLQSLLSSRGGISQIGGSIDQSALFARASAGGALGGFAAYRTSSLEQFLPMAGLEDAARSWIERVQRVPSILMRLQRVEQELAEADPASARLAVLLRHVGAGHAVATMEQMLSQGFQALVDPLAAILLSPEALGRFGTVIRNADLPSHVKNDLLHALEHLAEGSSDHALPPLLTGLEGAFRHAVRATGDRKSRSNARSLVAVLGMERDHKLLVGAIYDHANDARHGIELERRDACVLALVGLVVWMNECLEQPAIDWLGMRLDEQLSGSLEVAA